MKVSIWAVVFFAAALAVSEVRAAPRDESIWIARITGRHQCQPATELPNLNQAIETLEAANQGITIRSALVGRLNDRIFCSACQCSDGTFFIAEVEKASSELTLLEWEVIDPRSVTVEGDLPRPLHPLE
jgi:hypothetical protein